MRLRPLIAAAFLLSAASNTHAATQSVAEVWIDAALEAIKIDFPHPPAHARNLFHLSAAMYDAWAAYDSDAVGYLHRESAAWPDLVEAREMAVSYAAYTVLTTRYARSVNPAPTIASLTEVMTNLGYSVDFMSTNGDNPAAVGNRCAHTVLNYASDDNSNEQQTYLDNSYQPTNDPMILALSGTVLDYPNRWQPLAFEFAQTQNGLEASKIQKFLGSQWHIVRPFALRREQSDDVYHDPGPPPQVMAVGDQAYKSNNVQVLYFSSRLDPDSTNMLDVSPGGPGKNNILGTHTGTGHPTNPVTGLPYTSNIVREGDFGRIIAEIWADGPDSETPPGHWNVLAGQAAAHPLFTRQFEGTGAALDRLEWDVKMYFAVNGALHDAATAAWTCKRKYDYVRPISSIRWLAQNGQCSDPSEPSYHTNGIYLVSNLVEVVTTNSAAPGQRHEHLATNLGEIAVFAWPGQPIDPFNDYGGRAWILARDWLPYQRDTFVTPAFAGYVSGHSTFSRAAAEILTLMTGNPFFPGGMLSYTAHPGDLNFEYGPSESIVLQWGTYYDAADEAGISRLYGGIHVTADDLPGRIIGSQAGSNAWQLAKMYFDGSILAETNQVSISRTGEVIRVAWDQYLGLPYRFEMSTNLVSGFTWTNDHLSAKETLGSVTLTNHTGPFIFRVNRTK